MDVNRWSGALVNKLCALLGRAELRDLSDVNALLARGGDLSRALNDAPIKDGGFSPVTLAWVLRGLDIGRIGRTLGWTMAEMTRIAEFRDQLVEKIVALAKPERED